MIGVAQFPDPNACQRLEDVGDLVYDETQDIWYECEYDKRRKVFTWVITPSVDS